MVKIWYRNPSKSEVIGRCGEDEKPEWPRRTDKSRKIRLFFLAICLFLCKLKDYIWNYTKKKKPVCTVLCLHQPNQSKTSVGHPCAWSC